MNRGTYFRSIGKCTIACLLALSTIAFVQVARGQGKQTTTTESSSKYGAGGTVETTSDDKYQIVKEVWKDKSGRVREEHYRSPRTGKNGMIDTWLFYKSGSVVETFRYFPAPDSYFRKESLTGEPIYSIGRPEAEEWIERIEKQFAKDGTIIDPSRPEKKEGGGNTKDEPPKLPDEKKKEDEGGDTKFEPPKLSRGETKSVPGPRVETGGGTHIDQCLVGKWVSGTSTSLNSSGMSGIHLAMSANGTVAATYDGMKPRNTTDARGNVVGSESWSGEASGQITTTNGQIVVTSKGSSSVVRSSTVNGTTQTNKVSSLAPVLPDAPYVLSYACSADSLEITITVNGLKVSQFEFTKQK